MRSTAVRRVSRTLGSDRSRWSTTCTSRISQRTFHSATKPSASTSTPPLPSSSPSLHLFENPAVREFKYYFLPEAVLSHQAVTWAKSAVEALDRPRDKRPAFFDYETSHCIICGVPLSGSYRTHQNTIDHSIRLDIVERAMGLLYTFYSQVAASDPMAVGPATTTAASATQLSTRRTRGHSNNNNANSVGGGAAGYTSRAAATQSCYHTSYTQSFLFDEDGVPSHELLHHRPKALQELDLVDVLLKRWWRTLNHTPPQKGSLTFNRILSLSADDLRTRLHRLRYLLFFLASRGVLRESVALVPRDNMHCFSHSGPNLFRSEAFERYEMIGDLDFKLMAPDRLRAVLPADEGGVADSLPEFGRILDSNHGLLAIYDYLNLDSVLSLSLANNKTKADVVEALIGELRTLLRSTEVAYNTDEYVTPGERANTVYLHAVVEHTLYEIGHVTLMWRLDSTLRNVKDIIKAAVEKEFGSSKHKRQGEEAAEGSEAELLAKAPRNALLPLLLLWERQHGGVHNVKEKADFAMMRRPARLSHAFQEGLRHLAPFPLSAAGTGQGDALAVELPCSPAVLLKKVKVDVVQSLTIDSHSTAASWRADKDCSADTVVSSSFSSTAGSDDTAAIHAVLMPDLKQTPCPRHCRPPDAAAVSELLNANCVVMCDWASSNS